MKNIIIAVIALAVLIGGYLIITNTRDAVPVDNDPGQVTNGEDTPATTTPDEVEDDTKTVIGTSAGGTDIVAYHYGEGDTDVLFVGGIHGGYSWNTALLAYELMDHIERNPNWIPEGVRVTVIPVLNPDGLKRVAGTADRFERGDVTTNSETQVAGRFNANNVDLNRNFDCDWNSVGTWQNRTVSGGQSVFSEPESRAMRDYILANKPDGVVVWYSAAGGVYSSSCHNGVLPGTTAMTDTYAKGSGYQGYREFDYYEITGDMVNWLAKEGVPAISVLLTNHIDTEWNKNRAGIEALLKSYAN